MDTLRGPEMKSNGGGMGTNETLSKALYKAFEAANIKVPR